MTTDDQKELKLLGILCLIMLAGMGTFRCRVDNDIERLNRQVQELRYGR